MKPTRIVEALKVCIAAKQPVFIWGMPGVGKSDVVRQVGKALKYKIADIRAVLLDPVDLRGLPFIENGQAKWCAPDFLPKSGKWILFLDELNAAPPLVQAACYQLVLDRRIGDYVLPKECVVIAAGNRETDRAVISRMPSPLANRFAHLDFDADLDDWVAWALEHGVAIEFIAFLRYRPELLIKFDPKLNEKAFPTPRSWVFTSNIFVAGKSNIEFDLAAGIVGEGAATELIGFLEVYRNLPDPDMVLMAPEKAMVPEDPATLYAICGALAHKASEQTIGRIIQYAGRLPTEFSVLLVRDCIKKDESVVKTRAFIKWASDNSDVLV